MSYCATRSIYAPDRLRLGIVLLKESPHACQAKSEENQERQKADNNGVLGFVGKHSNLEKNRPDPVKRMKHDGDQESRVDKKNNPVQAVGALRGRDSLFAGMLNYDMPDRCDRHHASGKHLQKPECRADMLEHPSVLPGNIDLFVRFRGDADTVQHVQNKMPTSPSTMST